MMYQKKQLTSGVVVRVVIFQNCHQNQRKLFGIQLKNGTNMKMNHFKTFEPLTQSGLNMAFYVF